MEYGTGDVLQLQYWEMNCPTEFPDKSSELFHWIVFYINKYIPHHTFLEIPQYPSFIKTASAFNHPSLRKKLSCYNYT